MNPSSTLSKDKISTEIIGNKQNIHSCQTPVLREGVPLSWQEALYIKELTDNRTVEIIPHGIDRALDYLTDPAKKFLTKLENELLLGVYKDELSLNEVILRVQLATGGKLSAEKARQSLAKALDKLRSPKCMRYILLGVKKARSLENARKKNAKLLASKADELLLTKDYSDATLRELLSIRAQIDRQIEESYLTFQMIEKSDPGAKIISLDIPKQVKKKLAGRGIVKVSDLLGKTEAEVRKGMRLTYEESYKLKKALKETGVVVA